MHVVNIVLLHVLCRETWKLSSLQRNKPYLGRTTHHQLDEIPATSFGCVDVSNRVESLQSAVLGQAAGQHGSLGPFGHPTCRSHLLAVGSYRVTLVEIWHPDNRSRLSSSPAPQVHLPSSTRGRSPRVGLGLCCGCQLLVAIWLFVIIQTGSQCAGYSCETIE